MFQIAICDDEVNFSSQLEKMITEYYFNSVEIDIFEDGESLVKAIKSEYKYDLIFLDIEMNGINGVETGLKIRNDLGNEMTQIVYVSSKENYYKLLFDVRPNNFLLKPIEKEKVIKEIEKAIQLSDMYNKSFVYKKSFTSYKVAVKDILYFESNDKKISMILSNGQDEFYGRLDEIGKKIRGTNFVQVHKSYLVNMDHVILFQYEKLKMSNGEYIAISQSRRKEVREVQLRYMREAENG